MQTIGGMLRIIVAIGSVSAGFWLMRIGAADSVRGRTTDAIDAMRSDSPHAPAGRTTAFLPLAVAAFDVREAPTAAPVHPSATATVLATETPPASSNCPLPTWPAPTPTDLPIPTATPSRTPIPGITPSTPPSPPSAPPLAILSLPDGRQQEAGVPFGCDLPDDCGDSDVVTPLEPITTTSPVRFRLRLRTPEVANTLVIYVHRVASAPPQDEGRGQPLRYEWEDLPASAADSRYPLLLRPEQAVTIARDPGFYVVELYAAWTEIGEVQYGFFVEVRP